ncbi:MAG: hypothetical protein WEC79_04520 [Thermomicrobiales bacterium]
MSAALERAWAWGPFVVNRRLQMVYPLSAAAVALAVIVAACAGGAGRQEQLTLDSVMYRSLPAELTGVKLPVVSADVIAIAGKLPEQLAGQGRLSYGGWQSDDRFVAGWGDIAAWGAPSGVSGAPPVQIVIRRVDALGQQTAESGGVAVITDANRVVNIAGRLEIGRDGRVVWSRRSGSGYTVAWGRFDNPWLYVVTAASERNLSAALLALAGAAGTHASGQTMLH